MAAVQHRCAELDVIYTMKIAIISSSFFPVIDGVTVAVYYRLKRLRDLGHRVILFCPDYSVLKNIYPDWRDYTGEIMPGIKVINLPSTASIGLDFERDVTSKSYQIVVQRLAEFEPDIIHVDEAERLATRFLKIPGVEFAKQHKIPCVAFFHTNYIDYLDDYLTLPLGLNSIIKKILGLIFANIYNSYNLTLIGSLITQQKLVTLGINNSRVGNFLGFDANNYYNNFKQSNFFLEEYHLNLIQSKIKLIFIGRLTPDKGWDFTLKALTKLPLEIVDRIAIIIAGDGDMCDRIEQTLKQLTPDVYLLGRIPPESVSALLTNGDIFITNSEKETKGLTVIEAAAAGLPAIAPRAGGVVDTIQDGVTGFLYQPQQIEDFLEKLSLLIGDRNLRESMGAKARESVQDYSWEQVVDNLIEVWMEQIDLINN